MRWPGCWCGRLRGARRCRRTEEMQVKAGEHRIRARLRAIADGLATGLAVLATVVVVTPLVAIFAYLVYKGASSLSFAFFMNIPKPEGESGGGMANAIVGSAVL